MSSFTGEQSTKYQQFRDFLSQNHIPTEDFRVVSTDSTGTHCAVWNQKTRVWSFWLVTDLTAPSKASSTHTHLLQQAQTNGASLNINATVWTDITTVNITFPTFPALTLVQLILFGNVQCSESVAADTFDLRIGDETTGSFNSYLGFNHVDIVSDSLSQLFQTISPSGTHTFGIQGQVNVGANTLAVKGSQLTVVLLETKSPLSGS